MPRSTAPLAGLKTMVVGGSTGIGRGIADAWAAQGAHVRVLSRSRPVGRGANGLTWAPLDLSDADRTRAVLAGFADEPLFAVCFSAVYYGDRRAVLGEVAETEWRRQCEVNLHGLWLTLRATLPALRRSAPGLFVSVSSEVVYNAGPGRSGYAATKAAAAGLTASIAQEEDGEAVRVVQVLPAGMVDSPGIRRRRPDDFDYSDYMRPVDFGPVAVELASTAGAGRHGDSLVVAPGGTWHSVRDGVPVSQSRPVATGGAR